jgi:hypothetical protein
MKEYITTIGPLLGSFKRIKVTRNIIYKVRDMVTQILGLNNLNELRDRYEGERFHENFSGKILSAYSLGKYLNHDFIDLEGGNYNIRYKPSLDILGLELDINYTYYGNLHLVPKKPKRPEVIMIRKNEHEFLICGYASINTLKKYQQESKNSLTSDLSGYAEFNGYNQLAYFETIEDLKGLLG